MKVLLADDEKDLIDSLKEILRRNNIDCDTVYNGSDAINYALCSQYELIILDIMMPKINGYDVLKELRRQKITTPVLFLSAKSEIDDKVQGLNLGADDYLTKPFSTKELLARIKALMRRQGEYIGKEITFFDLVLDMDCFLLRSHENEIKLGNYEYKIIEMLMINQKSVIQKDRLIEKVWGYNNEAEYNNAEVYISFLRKKLLAIKSKVIIKAVRGIGYRLEIGDINNEVD